jgi:hypothetical protein
VLDTLSASEAGGEVGGLVLREAVHVRFPKRYRGDGGEDAVGGC